MIVFKVNPEVFVSIRIRSSGLNIRSIGVDVKKILVDGRLLPPRLIN